LQSAISEVLDKLAPYRNFLHEIRAENGTIELFIGWFFEGNSGDVFAHETLAIAGDLKVDISLDIYPPDRLGDILRRRLGLGYRLSQRRRAART